MSEAEVIKFMPPKDGGLTRAMLPEDIRDATEYIVDHDVLGDLALANEARAIVNAARCYTLGQAIEAISKRRSDMKMVIRMPEPRQPPWRNPPAILVGGRLPPGRTLRLTDKQRANILELLKLLGFRNGNPPEQFAGIGGTWMSTLGLDIENGEPISEEPDFTHEELRERLKR